MPNVEYIASSSFTAGNGTTIGSVVKPAGTEIGHCIIAQMYIELGSSLGSYTIASTGDTWTLVNSCINTGSTPDMELVTWRCIVGNASSIIGVTWNGTSTRRDFAIHVFANVDATTPEDCASTNNTGNSAAETGLSVTTVTDGAHLVMLTANFAGGTRSAWTSGLTERNDSGNVAMAAGVQLVAGASGNKTNTITSDQWGAVLMALRPATGIINFGGFETGDFVDAVSSAGTVSIASAIKRSGNYSLRINPTAGTGNAVYNALLTTGKAAEIGRMGTTYVTFYLYVASRPAANCALVRFRDSAANEVVRINLDTAGEIRIVGTTTSADIATLSNSTWYRIDMRITGNGTCGLKVDGGTETTLTGNNFTFDRITFGPTTAHTLDVYIDDWAASDAGVVATPQVTMAVPTGSGNYSSFTDGTGSTYAEVDEVPHDSGTTYLQNTAGTSVAHTLAMQNASTIGASGSILAVKVLAIMAESTSTTTQGGVRMRSSTSDRDTISVDIGNTTYVPIQRVFVKDPATAAAWTSGGVDAIEVGPFKGSDSSSIRATAAYAMVLTDGAVSANITGVAATATAAGLAGSVAAVRTTSGTGVPATATAAGLAGAITTATNASVSGATATATAAGLAGSVATVRIASISGTTATATATGIAGSVATVRNASISGATATATAAGIAGSVAAVRIANVSGETATATAAGLAGSLSGAVSATITGEAATAIAAGIAGTVATVRIATISGGTGTATAAGADGSVAAVRTTPVTGTAATASAAGLAGTVAAVRIVTIFGETATATATGNAGSLTGAVSASISGATATATAAGVSGVLAAVRIVGISGVTATASAAGLAGSVTSAESTSISGTTATATATALSGALAAVRISTVSGQPATATALGSAGSLAAIRIVSISGTTATATSIGYSGSAGSEAATIILTITGSDTARFSISGSDAITTILDGSDASRLTLSGSESFDVIYGSDTSRVTVTGE